MPPSDQEPRYQLVDSNGNVVGSLFGDGSGNVVIADETDTQTTFGPDGITTPALEADSQATGGQDAINYWPFVPLRAIDVNDSSPPSSYQTATLSSLPSDATHALIDLRVGGNGTDNETEAQVREAGVSRSRDVVTSGDASHGYLITNSDIVPVSDSKEIEYKADAASQVLVEVTGYF